MAIGLGEMFGLRLPVNFDSPYKATSIIGFWRRWHMTLSRFLRDYVYISLGGNRKGEPRRYVNLFLTMLIGGIWHGAGWTYIVWGAIHGVLLVLTVIWQKLIGPVRPNKVRQFFGWLFTFGAFVFAVVFFGQPISGRLGSWSRRWRGSGITWPPWVMPSSTIG